MRSQALLALVDGAQVRGVARDFDTLPNTMTRRRDLFVEMVLAILGRSDQAGGRKCSITSKMVQAVVAATLTTVPDDGSCWPFDRWLLATDWQGHRGWNYWSYSYLRSR